MAKASAISIDLAHRFCETFVLVGGTSDELNELAKNKMTLRRFLEDWRDKEAPRVLDCSTPYNLNTSRWSVWRGAAEGTGIVGEKVWDVRANALVEVDFRRVKFLTFCKSPYVKRGSVFSHLRNNDDEALLGGQQFLALWKDYIHNRERSVLAWLERTKEITCVLFMGLVLRSPSGFQCVIRLRIKGDEKKWHWEIVLLDEVMQSGERVAVCHVTKCTN